VEFTTSANAEGGAFWPFLRDPETLARPWAIPGTPGLEHRIGGLEKLDGPGTPSHDAGNHEHMVRTRAAKIEGIARTLPPLEIADPGEAEGNPSDVLVLGWGSSYGPVAAACRRLRRSGVTVAHAHLRHLNPFPPGVEEALHRYRKVIVPELNLGQLAQLLQAKFCVKVTSLPQVRGTAFRAEDLVPALREEIER
jgi:2-oxoglutarate ferredoxin oxidoreductase subunit alpha